MRPFVAEILASTNAGLLNPQSAMLVTKFVERVHLPECVSKKLRPASLKQYRDMHKSHLKGRLDEARASRIPRRPRRVYARWRSRGEPGWAQCSWSFRRRFSLVRSTSPVLFRSYSHVRATLRNKYKIWSVFQFRTAKIASLFRIRCVFSSLPTTLVVA